MPKVSESYRDARRAQILKAAIICFSRKGFHRATMQDVVKQSNLSPGAIYNYFASKEEIIEAIASDRLEKEKLLFGAAKSQVSFSAALDLLRDAFLGELKNPEERLRRRVSIQLWAEAQRNPRILKLVRTGLDIPRKHLVDLVSAAQRRGEVSENTDPDGLARFLIALFYGLVLQVEWDNTISIAPQVYLLKNLFPLVETGRANPLRRAKNRRR